MPSVGIIGNNGYKMMRAFLHLCRGAINCYHITENRCFEPKINVLVADSSDLLLPNLIQSLTNEDFLIINTDEVDIFATLERNCAKVITYGFNSRACITASSVTDDSLQLCIQRAFVDWTGKVRSPQEFSASVTSLGAAAAWAVVGQSGSKPLSA